MTVAADQWEIRQLIERYAGAVDRSDGASAAELFATDGALEMWLDPTKPDPTSRRHGREEIGASLGLIDRFAATHHMIGSAVVTVDGDHATGSTQCAAHHLESDGAELIDRVLFINYLDEFRRVDGRWQIARRELKVKWTSVLPVESA